jgi:hypothetical protein
VAVIVVVIAVVIHHQFASLDHQDNRDKTDLRVPRGFPVMMDLRVFRDLRV